MRGVALTVYLPSDTPTTLVIATLHGEEPETGFLAHRLHERVRADQACCAIVACANPDALLTSRRQNANGVDLNRNFPARTWTDAPSYTYPPGCLDRRSVRRTNRSSPGTHAASEPETTALIGLIETLRPALILDLHAPLELIVPTVDVPDETADALAGSAGMMIEYELGLPTPGSLRDLCRDRGLPCITYEVEHAGLPGLWRRHGPGLVDLARGALPGTGPQRG